MKIDYLGQNCFSINTENGTLLTDPAVSVNPLAKHINTDSLNADYILLTHAHGDHSADVEPLLKRTGATLVSNYEIATHYGNLGHKYHPMNHGGRWQFPWGTLAMTNAIHTSTFPDGTNGGQPCGFVIMADNKTIYMAGDTALTMDMQLIPRQYGKIDLCILPIGDNFTMGIEDACIAAEFVQCNRILGCHFDTFPYIEIEHEYAKSEFSKKNLELTLLDIGDSLTL